MSQIIDSIPQDFTFIGDGTSVQGTFVFKGDTKVAGRLKGEIRIADNAPLSIEPTGSVEGTLYCNHLSVFGDLKGDVRSTGTITFFPSSTFEGQIQAKNLVIHPGSNVFMEAQTEGEAEETAQ